MRSVTAMLTGCSRPLAGCWPERSWTAVLAAQLCCCCCWATAAATAVTTNVRTVATPAALPRYDNRGAFDKFWGETTPLLYHGELVRMETRYSAPFESHAAAAVAAVDDSTDTAAGPGLKCQPATGFYCSPGHMRIRRVRDRAVIADPIPGSLGIRYGSAYVDQAGTPGEALYAFASNWCDDFDNSTGLRCQHGTNGTRVLGFRSSDPALKNWTSNVALELPAEYQRRGCRVFNTDVHPGPAGSGFVMVMEMQGHPWCPGVGRNFFATHPGGRDLSQGWTLLDPTAGYIHPQSGDTYGSACPSIRFVKPHYYLIFSAFWQMSAHNESRADWGPDYDAFLYQYVSRSKDLKQWELSLSPIVVPDGVEDKILKDGFVPSPSYAQALRDMNDTNVSDLDMVRSVCHSCPPPSDYSA